MALTPQQAAGKKLGSYELLKEVAASSVGATFVAKSASSSASVVLTKIHRHVAKSPQLCDALAQEAKKATSLTHANIAAVVDHGTVDGEPFVTHEHHDGDTLAALLRKAGPDGLPLPVAARIVADLLAGLATAHDAGVFHGELGPWCVQIGADGVSRVSGFGVDRAISRFGLHFAKNLDRLPFAAPERVKAMSLTLGPTPPAPDRASDLFSAAVLVWELFTRNRLFASRMEAAVIQKVLTGAIPDPKSQRAELSEMVSAALSKALTREPGARGTIDELAAVVESSPLASHAEVADLASKMVDKAAAKAPAAGAARAFNSVRPGPLSQRPPAPVNKDNGSSNGASNGSAGAAMPTPGDARPKSAPPAAPGASAPKAPAKRAQTLMGFGGALAAPKVPSIESAIEDDVTVEAKKIPPAPESAQELRDSSVEILMEESSTSDGDALIQTVETAKAPEKPAPKAPPPPAGRRPPPKPRQHTLMGIEPLQEEPVDEPTIPVEDVKPAVAAAAVAASPASPAVQEKAQEKAAPAAASPAAPFVQEKVQEKAPPAVRAKTFSLGDLGPGSVLGEGEHHYQLVDAVAKGGMATVWAARKVGASGLSELVAIKTMLPELSDESDFELMFLDEMRVAARIKHENVAQILHVGEQGGVMYIVMEWVDGDTLGGLQQGARASGGLSTAALVEIASQICAGLHAAHELRDSSGQLIDLVHRDVNPANVLVNRAGKVKVVDFGISKSKGRMHVTRVGNTVKGKTPFLAPEQLGGLAIDRRVDLFSLGCLLYQLSTGVHPFRGDSELKTVENIVLKQPASLRSIVPDIHPDFEKLVLRLLEKDPKKRFETAEDVRVELGRIREVLEKPATPEDLAGLVSKALSDVLRDRDKQLVDALKTFAPEDPAAAGAKGKSLVVTESPGPAEAILASASYALPALPEAPSSPSEPEPIAAAIPVAPAPSFEVPDTSGSPELSSDALAAPPTGFEEDPPDLPQRRPMSPWVRLSLLIAVGVVVGIGIIAAIEAMRGKSPEPGPSATPASSQAAPKPTPSPTPTPTPTAAPTPTPTATATETAAPTATETAAPTADPTPPATNTARPPATGTTPRPPGTLPRPTSTVKKPPPYKPTTI